MARLIATRKSKIHGNGMFALQDIPAGTVLIEYKGRRITPKQADAWHDEMYSGHTFLFTLNDDWIIDANVGGNSARWINHSCAPNCIPYLHDDPADNKKDKVFIEALRDIKKGEELSYDYGISFNVPYTARLKKIWACRCGAKNCTGTLLKPPTHERKTK